MTVKELDQNYVANTYKRFPVEIVKGKGSFVYDENGKEYIDMGSGIAVNTFGLSDETWIRAVESQLEKFQHTSNLYYTEPCALLAKTLCEKTGMKKVFFSNSGAEANECAIKAARKYASETKGSEYFTIVTLKNSFHGRTLTTLSATGQDRFHELFQPLTPGFVHVSANDENELEEVLKTQKIAAVMIECVQGEGGVMPLSEKYVKNLFSLAKKYGVLTIVDEVQTGNGRTGKLYSYMNCGVSPDSVSTAKGLGGGLPLGATMLSEKLENVFGYGDHGSTFGANPVCCAGALSVLSRLDEPFLKTVREKSEFLFETFSNAGGIKSVSGMGLMIGLETEKPASDVVSECIQNGVLCLTAKNKVRLLPALNIPTDVLAKAAEIIKRACAD